MKKYTLTVVRKCLNPNSGNTFTESKPCLNCLKMLKKYGIRKIIYTSYDGSMKKYKVNKLETEHQSLVFEDLYKKNILKKIRV